ncbi:gamma-crystallin 2-like [Ambystoma mexicanum]|uniref:gamma-crystallin 2-like n=1 Tax=Ambystoma mexicanum TaxID=8296 RepID=UPI0037E8F289
MGKIIFYEDRNFQGRCHESCGDNADLHSYLSRCNSIRIESGCWVIYERPNYIGNQYILKKGEYPDYQNWMGINDSIRSCHSVPQHHGGYRLRIYEGEDFSGQTKEYQEDCVCVYENFRLHDINSCNVLEGYWIFYEESQYKGKQYFLRPGEYRRFSNWGALTSKVGSFRRVKDFY